MPQRPPSRSPQTTMLNRKPRGQVTDKLQGLLLFRTLWRARGDERRERTEDAPMVRFGPGLRILQTIRRI